MANHSLTDSIIKKQIDTQEMLSDSLAKAEAMTCVTASADFLDYDSSIIHAYLSALGDVIINAKKLNEEILEIFMFHSKEKFFCSCEG